MREERVSFAPRGEPALRLEGRLLDGGGAPLVVSHPHPLHGGTMDHPVVAAIFRAGGGAGSRALRYNFRGVGASTGRLAPGDPLPVADLAGALDFLGPAPAVAVCTESGPILRKCNPGDTPRWERGTSGPGGTRQLSRTASSAARATAAAARA